jgi:hypothetical protein
MKRTSLNAALVELHRKTDQSISLANDTAKFREFRGDKYRPISKLRRMLIVELSFLQISNAWEGFLEETFFHYMCGQKTQSGFSPSLLVTLKNATLDQAASLVNQTKPYSDWSRADEVIKRAKLYFANGEPYYRAIANSNDKLEEIRKIRNGIAHSSAYSREKLEELIRQKTGSGSLVKSAGELLCYSFSTGGQNLLQDYGSLLKVLGSTIVP